MHQLPRVPTGQDAASRHSAAASPRSPTAAQIMAADRPGRPDADERRAVDERNAAKLNQIIQVGDGLPHRLCRHVQG